MLLDTVSHLSGAKKKNHPYLPPYGRSSEILREGRLQKLTVFLKKSIMFKERVSGRVNGEDISNQKRFIWGYISFNKTLLTWDKVNGFHKRSHSLPRDVSCLHCLSFE